MVLPVWRAPARPRPLARGAARPERGGGGRHLRLLVSHPHAFTHRGRAGAGVQPQPAAGTAGGLVQQPADPALHVPLRLSHRLSGAAQDAGTVSPQLDPALAGARGGHPGAPLPARQPAAGGADRRQRRPLHPAAVAPRQAGP